MKIIEPENSRTEKPVLPHDLFVLGLTLWHANPRLQIRISPVRISLLFGIPLVTLCILLHPNSTSHLQYWDNVHFHP